MRTLQTFVTLIVLVINRSYGFDLTDDSVVIEGA